MANEKRILVIEDDDLYASYLEKIIVNLLKLEYKRFSNPPDAFEWLNEGNEVDLIMLDMEMPRMDGLTALTHIRVQLGLRELPVIICSSLSNADLVSKLLKLKISDYIHKKSASKVILQKIVTVLAKNA